MCRAHLQSSWCHSCWLRRRLSAGWWASRRLAVPSLAVGFMPIHGMSSNRCADHRSSEHGPDSWWTSRMLTGVEVGSPVELISACPGSACGLENLANRLAAISSCHSCPDPCSGSKDRHLPLVFLLKSTNAPGAMECFFLCCTRQCRSWMKEVSIPLIDPATL